MDFKIFVGGIEIPDVDKLREISEYYLVDNLKLMMNNFSLLDDHLDHFIGINYTDLSKIVDKIPDLFFEKFYRIHRVTTSSKVIDKQMFCCFLKNLNFISRLELNNPELDQDFYDRLPTIVPYGQITLLIINEKEENPIKFDFLLEFKSIEWIGTNQPCHPGIDLFKKQNDLKILKDKNLIIQPNGSRNAFYIRRLDMSFIRRSISFEELQTCFHQQTVELMKTKKI